MSFSKILLTVLIAFAVWYGFRWLSRLAQQEQAKPLRRPREPKGIGPVEDLIACSLCGDYAPSGAAPCGRADCPRR